MTSTSAGSLQDLRRSNQERLLSLLLQEGPMHRAELARRAQISRTTVSTITAELIDRGILTATSDEAAMAGRDGRARDALTVDSRAGAAVGLDFTSDQVSVYLSDLRHQRIGEATAALPPGSSWTERIDIGMGLLHDTCRAAGLSPQHLIGAGIGVPGPVEVGTGIVGRTLPDQPWTGVPAAAEFGKRLGIPVFVENNTRLEAVAEAVWGAGQGAHAMLYLGLSTGIGAGIVIDGRPYRGALGGAGALGHVSVNIDGPACGCGNRGCLVLYGTTYAVIDSLRARFAADGVTDPSIDDILDACAAGDRACRGVIADVGGLVGRLLASLCNLLNPDRIVVGGELARAGDVLLDPMRTAIRRYALTLARDADVRRNEINPNVHAGALGGAALVLRETPKLTAALKRLLR